MPCCEQERRAVIATGVGAGHSGTHPPRDNEAVKAMAHTWNGTRGTAGQQSSGRAVLSPKQPDTTEMRRLAGVHPERRSKALCCRRTRRSSKVVLEEPASECCPSAAQAMQRCHRCSPVRHRGSRASQRHRLPWLDHSVHHGPLLPHPCWRIADDP